MSNIGSLSIAFDFNVVAKMFDIYFCIFLSLLFCSLFKEICHYSNEFLSHHYTLHKLSLQDGAVATYVSLGSVIRHCNHR